jgi:hypothetical protein
MASPRYMKVGGRPVFKILGPYNFLARQCGGNTTLALSLIAQLRQRALAAGVGNPLVGGGWIGEAQAAPPAEDGRVIYQGIDVDYTGTYNSAGRSPSLGECVSSGAILPFSQMADYNDGALWGNHSDDAAPWVPNIDAGYDIRPAVGANLSGQCTFGVPTQGEWEAYQLHSAILWSTPGSCTILPACRSRSAILLSSDRVRIGMLHCFGCADQGGGSPEQVPAEGQGETGVSWGAIRLPTERRWGAASGDDLRVE